MRARRLLDEVHALARAYAWSERQILSCPRRGGAPTWNGCWRERPVATAGRPGAGSTRARSAPRIRPAASVHAQVPIAAAHRVERGSADADAPSTQRRDRRHTDCRPRQLGAASAYRSVLNDDIRSASARTQVRAATASARGSRIQRAARCMRRANRRPSPRTATSLNSRRRLCSTRCSSSARHRAITPITPAPLPMAASRGDPRARAHRGARAHRPHRSHRSAGASRAEEEPRHAAQYAAARGLPGATEAVVSTALAIAGVTQVLRDLLNDRFVNQNVAGQIGQSVTVSTMPPDKVVQQNGVEATQLNLFLRQVTPNLGWRNEGLPSRDGVGPHAPQQSAAGAQPALPDLAPTAPPTCTPRSCSATPCSCCTRIPAIPREAIRIALQPPPDRVGHAAALAARAARLRTAGPDRAAAHHAGISRAPRTCRSSGPSTLAHYRPSAAYEVSVVLIQAEEPTPSRCRC